MKDFADTGPTLGDYDIGENSAVIPDPYAAADFRRDQFKDASSCAKCGSLEPARIEGGRCSDCSDFPRCWNCGRWVGDGSTWLPAYVNVLDGDDDVKVCGYCWTEVA